VQKKYKKIHKCRLCKKKNLKSFVNFGAVPLGNDLLKTFNKAVKAKTYPLKVLKCLNCNHFQLSHSVSPKILYQTNYTYLSGVSDTFKLHFKKYVDWINRYTKLYNLKKAKVLDIGSNDGTCLVYFKKKGCRVLGVDPAFLPAKIANNNGIETINDFFNDKISSNIINKFGKFNFITSHNVLAHVENLENIFKLIFNTLENKGFFCFEIGYFLKVLKNNYFDTIYHEHLDYHHATPLFVFLNKIGFSIKRISTNKIQGGSLRILCQKKLIVKNNKQAIDFINIEKNSILFDSNFLNNWNNNIYENMSKIKKIVNFYMKKKYDIIGYGSPTKIVLMLKIANLNFKDIRYVIEDNKLKIGRFLPKTGIKINKFNINNVKKPVVIIVFAWNFFEEIVKKTKSTLPKNSKIICPLPQTKIISL